jgi:Ankyrin repeats (many copies)/Ankyrin repeat
MAGTKPPLSYLCGINRLVRELESGLHDIEARNDMGSTALHTAVHYGDVRAVNILLHYGADAHTLNGEGTSVMTSAAEHGYASIVKTLHDNGVDADTPIFYTPLHAAAYGGYVDVVRMLLEFGVDQSRPDEYGDTALDYALAQYEKYALEGILDLADYAEIVVMLSVAEEILKERCLAFAMGCHARLGEDSLMNELPDDVYNKIVKLRPFKKD